MEKRYLTKKMGERDLQETKASAGGGFMTSLATFIVDKRNLFFLLTILMLVFSAFSRNWVDVESELTAYLPSDSQTRQALDVMEEQFTTYGTAQIMAANISQAEAEALQAQIAGIKGVQGVEYDNTEAHYNKSSALYTVTFDYDEPDEACLTSLDEIRSALSAYDLYVSTELGNAEQEAIDSEVSVIMVYVAVIIVLVLLFTSQTYAEVPVLILTFVVAMIMNLGTNFLLGKISFVSNSVTSILQLALSLDYAVIFCNRCKEEHQNLPIREAAIVALSKAIPEIGASSLTTIGGLVAMMFMQFKIGADMAVCLIKSILFALLSVFVVMPGLLVLFGKLMDKTEHRSFVPKIPFVGKFAYKTRFVMPLIFVAAIVLAFPLSQKCPYAYGESSLETPVLNETQIAQNMIDDTFTSTNMLALMVPAGDYEKEAAILEELSAYEEVDSAMGIANVEAMDGCMLADKLTPREFAELTGLDYEAAQLVYAAYGASQEELGQVLGNLVNYQVPLIDMFLFVCDQVDSGLVTLDDEQTAMLDEAYTQMTAAKKQLQGSEYSRMLVYLNLPESGDETCGAVSGSETGGFTGNYYVSDILAGLGRISCAGKAEPMTFAQLEALEGVPEEMTQFTLRFVADGTELLAQEFEYGASFGAEVYPDIPAKEGCYAVWDTLELNELHFDTTVTADYHRYVLTLTSEAVRESGRPVFLLDGDFDEDAALTVTGGESTAQIEGRQAVEQWTLQCSDTAQGSYTVRYLTPEEKAQGRGGASPARGAVRGRADARNGGKAPQKAQAPAAAFGHRTAAGGAGRGLVLRGPASARGLRRLRHPARLLGRHGLRDDIDP